MAFDLSSISQTAAIRAPRLIVYGGAGIGKTTLAACAPNPIFLFTEEGDGKMTLNAFPLVTEYSQIMEAISSLTTGEHPFQTVAIDSLDHLEPIIWAETCHRNNWTSIEQPGFGKGYVAASDIWREFFSTVDQLRNQRNMLVIYICHDRLEQVIDPTSGEYSRHGLKLHKRASELSQEWVDAVLFATSKTAVIEKDSGFNKKSSRAVSTGGRVLLSDPTNPAYLAKNRYSLPSEMPLTWEALNAGLTA